MVARFRRDPAGARAAPDGRAGAEAGQMNWPIAGTDATA